MEKKIVNEEEVNCTECVFYMKERKIIDVIIKNYNNLSQVVSNAIQTAKELEMQKLIMEEKLRIQHFDMGQEKFSIKPFFIDHCLRKGIFPNSPKVLKHKAYSEYLDAALKLSVLTMTKLCFLPQVLYATITKFEIETGEFLHQIENKNKDCTAFRSLQKNYSHYNGKVYCEKCDHFVTPFEIKTSENQALDKAERDASDAMRLLALHTANIGAMGNTLNYAASTIGRRDQYRITSAESTERERAREILDIVRNNALLPYRPNFHNWCFWWSELEMVDDSSYKKTVKKFAICDVFNQDNDCQYYYEKK